LLARLLRKLTLRQITLFVSDPAAITVLRAFALSV